MENIKFDVVHQIRNQKQRYQTQFILENKRQILLQQESSLDFQKFQDDRGKLILHSNIVDYIYSRHKEDFGGLNEVIEKKEEPKPQGAMKKFFGKKLNQTSIDKKLEEAQLNKQKLENNQNQKQQPQKKKLQQNSLFVVPEIKDAPNSFLNRLQNIVNTSVNQKDENVEETNYYRKILEGNFNGQLGEDEYDEDEEEEEELNRILARQKIMMKSYRQRQMLFKERSVGKSNKSFLKDLEEKLNPIDGIEIEQNTTGLENGKFTKFYLTNLQNIELASCLFACITIGLTIFYYDTFTQLDHSSEKVKFEKISTMLMFVIRYTTFINLFLIIFSYYVDTKLRIEQLKISKKSNMFTGGDFFKLVLELIISAAHPNQNFSDITIEMQNSYDASMIKHKFNDFMCVFVVIRIYILIRFYFTSHVYNSPRGQRLCTLYGNKPGYIFCLKAMLKDNPFKQMCQIYMVFVFTLGYSLRVFEMAVNDQLNDYQMDYSQYFNSFWGIATAMTTVGYGDYKPRSMPGRCIQIISAIIGSCLSSLATILLKNFLEMEQSEIKVRNIYFRLETRQKIDLKSKHIIKKFLQYVKALKQNNYDRNSSAVKTAWALIKKHQVIFKELKWQLKTSSKQDTQYEDLQKKFEILKDNLIDIRERQVQIKDMILKMTQNKKVVQGDKHMLSDLAKVMEMDFGGQDQSINNTNFQQQQEQAKIEKRISKLKKEQQKQNLLNSQYDTIQSSLQQYYEKQNQNNNNTNQKKTQSSMQNSSEDYSEASEISESLLQKDPIEDEMSKQQKFMARKQIESMEDMKQKMQQQMLKRVQNQNEEISVIQEQNESIYNQQSEIQTELNSESQLKSDTQLLYRDSSNFNTPLNQSQSQNQNQKQFDIKQQNMQNLNKIKLPKLDLSHQTFNTPSPSLFQKSRLNLKQQEQKQQSTLQNQSLYLSQICQKNNENHSSDKSDHQKQQQEEDSESFVGDDFSDYNKQQQKKQNNKEVFFSKRQSLTPSARNLINKNDNNSVLHNVKMENEGIITERKEDEDEDEEYLKKLNQQLEKAKAADLNNSQFGQKTNIDFRKTSLYFDEQRQLEIVKQLQNYQDSSENNSEEEQNNNKSEQNIDSTQHIQSSNKLINKNK